MLCITSAAALCLALVLFNTEYIRNEIQMHKFEAVKKEIKGICKNNGFSELYKKNKDCAAYLDIPDSNISYPVMQTKNNPEFYLNHDFSKEYSFFGTPFLDYRCDISSTNLIVYGHNITGKRYFGELTNYYSYEYYKKHKIINLITSDEESSYEIISVMNTNIYSSWYQFINLNRNDIKKYRVWLKYVFENSIYECDLNKNITEIRQFLTLSTCQDTGGDERLLVIALKK